VPSDDVQRISRAIGALMRVAESERVHTARQRGTGIDLSRTEVRFLATVNEVGPLPVTTLGTVLHLSQPTASRTLRRLEDAGLVERLTDTDGRVVRFGITPAGRTTWERFEAFMATQLDEALSGMSASRRRELAALLEELVEGTHRAQEGAGS
jgi:DNA-binding MarR family transcriptional regulator